GPSRLGRADRAGPPRGQYRDAALRGGDHHSSVELIVEREGVVARGVDVDPAVSADRTQGASPGARDHRPAGPCVCTCHGADVQQGEAAGASVDRAGDVLEGDIAGAFSGAGGEHLHTAVALDVATERLLDPRARVAQAILLAVGRVLVKRVQVEASNGAHEPSLRPAHSAWRRNSLGIANLPDVSLVAFMATILPGFMVH